MNYLTQQILYVQIGFFFYVSLHKTQSDESLRQGYDYFHELPPCGMSTGGPCTLPHYWQDIHSFCFKYMLFINPL